MFPKEEEKTTEPVFYSMASEPTTEFRKAILGKRAEDLIPIFDELMTALQVISPRLYDGTMRKITEY